MSTPLKKQGTDKILSALGMFTGTENWYRHPFCREYLHTDGVQFMAEELHAFWLIDYIMSQQHDKDVRAERFQTWFLKVGEDSSAEIWVEDGNNNIVKQWRIPYTDFPIKDAVFDMLWLVDKTLLLRSEY